MKIAISSITGNGNTTAKLLSAKFDSCDYFYHSKKGGLREWTTKNFHKYDAHIFIMSLGIVYRIINSLISNKYEDPAVVVVDDARRFSIAALSGHEGGANNLAFQVAQYINAKPVITTASDTNKNITIGIGCRKGATKVSIITAVNQVLSENNISIHDIRVAASAEIKCNEKGLLEAFKELGIPLLFLSLAKLKNFSGFNSISDTAKKYFDIPGVCEPAAILVGREATLIQTRKVIGPVTVALAKEEIR